MSQFFLKIHLLVKQYRLLALTLFMLLVAATAFFAQKIKFEEDITQLIPSNEKSEVTQRVLNTVSFADKIIVNIETKNGASADSITAYATDFIEAINKDASDYVAEIQGKVSDENVLNIYDFVYDNLPLFLSKEDYERIEQKVQSDSIEKTIEESYKALSSPLGLITRKYIVKDPLNLTMIGLEKLSELQLANVFELYNGFWITKDHKNILLFITSNQEPNETAKNTVFVDRLNHIQSALNIKYKESASACMFGTTLYAVANAKQIKSDIQKTVIIAMSILLMILIFFYRKISVPILIFVPTALGAVVAIAVLYIAKGKISAISLGIGSVLLGITLDYSLHILTHFRNNANVKALYKDVTLPILMSSLTTATAFLCLLFVKSEALNDLGIFAAVSVVTASIFALLLIPQAYKFKEKECKQKKTIIDTLASIKYHQNSYLIIFVILIFITSLFLFKKVGFDNDLSKMNYQPHHLKVAEKKLEQITDAEGTKSVYLVTYGSNLDEALSFNDELHEKLKKEKSLGNVIDYSTLGGIVLAKKTQEEKIALWNSYWTSKKKDTVINLLKSKGAKKGFKEKTFTPFYNLLSKDVQILEFEDYKSIKPLYINDFLTKEEGFATVMSAISIPTTTTNNVLKTLSEGKNKVLIDRKELNETFLGNLKNDFNTLIGYSVIAVLLLLLLLYRDSMLTIITALPIAITWVITLGIMKMLAIDFNIFNIIISTFIFGLGVDYSIFITNGLIKEYTYGTKELATYKTSILLSVITTILGVGVLIFAKHPALRSISIVSLIGIIASVIVAYTIQPLLFRILIVNRSNKGLSPLKLRQTIHSILSFGWFIEGGFLLSFLSTLIIPWLPMSKKKKMRIFHHLVSKLMKFTLHTNGFVKKEIDNKIGENFEKQCILIANHTSFLDILTMGMLHPKLIFLVKDAVYNSPIYGKAVRMAGFYPVSSGIDKGVEHLKEKVKQGYSLIAFPEGTRTETAKMGRFHKGSFFLAEELDLDILPVLIHGNSQVSPKRDFIIEDGRIHVKLLPRITQENTEYGKGYAQRTKLISRYFKEEYRKLQDAIEDVDYYTKAILNNYLYKDCYGIVKNDIKRRKHDYFKVAALLEATDKVLYYGNDHGQALLNLSFKKPYIKFFGIIEDQEKLAIAKRCYSVKRNKIKYLEESQIEASKVTVLLLDLDSELKEFDSTKTLINTIDKIIVLSNTSNAMRFPDFAMDFQKENMTILSRI